MGAAVDTRSRPALSRDAAVCEQIQEHLVAGDLPLDRYAHVDGCSECRFVAQLSQRFGGVTSSAPGEDPLGSAASGQLADAVAGGEPLLGRYRLLGAIGSGGQGRVFRARDLETDDVVAIKLVRLRAPDAKVLEVAHARRVRHPNVCRVFHAERRDELRVIVMELLEGPTLAEALPALGRAPRLRMFRGVCEGVAAAHDAGVLHLDIKPENVIVHCGAPVVTDFGLSVLATGSALAHGGTAAYMAPEQRRNEPVDARADVFALGRLLERLLGDRPGVLRPVVQRATAAAPAARYADAHALLADLERRLRARRRRATLAAVAAGAGGLVALLALAVEPPRGRRAPYPEEIWGPDSIPRPSWNVALDATGSRGIRLATSHPGFACGQSLPELVDAMTEYHDWKHGFAFPPRPPGVCVDLGLLGTCGARRDDARLCQKREGGAVPLDALVASAVSAGGGELGQWTEGVPCGERWIEVELDRPRPVRALRVWHHGLEHVPTRQRVEIEDAGGWRAVYRTTERPTIATPAFRGARPDYDSTPTTLDFPPVTARRVRWVMDSCSIEAAVGHGWVYELEVFADVPRAEAWYRTLRGD